MEGLKAEGGSGKTSIPEGASSARSVPHVQAREQNTDDRIGGYWENNIPFEYFDSRQTVMFDSDDDRRKQKAEKVQEYNVVGIESVAAATTEYIGQTRMVHPEKRRRAREQ